MEPRSQQASRPEPTTPRRPTPSGAGSAPARPARISDAGRKASAGELAARAAAALRQVTGSPRGSAVRRDSLTGLFDDRALHSALADAVGEAEEQGSNIGLLFIDLDNFKDINDRYGHVAGSRILSQVAELVDAASRQAGGVAARYGGDEFVVVLPGANADRCLGLAERLRAALAAAILAGGEPPHRRPLVQVTCSIGAVSTGTGGSSGRTSSRKRTAIRLLQAADNAMYEAKRAGCNRVAAAAVEAAGAA